MLKSNNKNNQIVAPSSCPQCGVTLNRSALSCPECGSDWQTGWSSQAEVDWELPDYDELLENEFTSTKKTSSLTKLKAAFVIAISLLLGLLLVGFF